MGLVGSDELLWIPIACCMKVNRSPTVDVSVTWKFLVVRSAFPTLPVKLSVPGPEKICAVIAVASRN